MLTIAIPININNLTSEMNGWLKIRWETRGDTQKCHASLSQLEQKDNKKLYSKWLRITQITLQLIKSTDQNMWEQGSLYIVVWSSKESTQFSFKSCSVHIKSERHIQRSAEKFLALRVSQNA